MTLCSSRTRSDPAIQELLLELLNLHGKECDKAHESDDGKLALRWLKDHPDLFGEAPTATTAGTTGLGATEVEDLKASSQQVAGNSRPQRQRQQTKRFDGFNNNSYLGSTPSGVEIDNPAKKIKGKEVGVQHTIRHAITMPTPDSLSSSLRTMCSTRTA